jgi:pumilio RNA-binding family
MASSQPFIPVLKDILPPSRSLSSSIWAPQPQPTEVSWQQALTCFSQSAEEEKFRARSDDRRGPTTFSATDNRGEDVFGPIDFFRADHKKDVGAIGDGRKKASPDTVKNVNRLIRYSCCMRTVDLRSALTLAH